MTLDELVEEWRKGMQDPSKDETAREHWLRRQIAAARADGYAEAREQAAQFIELSGAECSAASKRRLAKGIRTMRPEGT